MRNGFPAALAAPLAAWPVLAGVRGWLARENRPERVRAQKRRARTEALTRPRVVP